MDAGALADLLIADHASFVRFARQRVANEADAADVVQRALIRAAERATSLDEPTRVRAWFYQILRHAIADHHRLGRGDAMQHRDDVDAPDIAGEDLEPVRTPCACAIRLLAEARPAYAEVVRRVDLYGEEPAVVAQALGISVDNLHVRLHRARRALRGEVQRHCAVVSVELCLDCTCHEHPRCGDDRRRSSAHSRPRAARRS